MAQLSKQPTLFRFRCPKCNIRLKTEAFNKGKIIICPQCKNAIPAERGAQPLPEASVIQRLDASVEQWVRTTCSCGKLVKAPAAFAGRTGSCPQCHKPVKMPQLGETMSSALEVSTFVQAPSDESLLMAVGSLPTEPESEQSTEITYSRTSPVESEPDSVKYLRAACICGAEVHADLEMAGKTVNCPKCGNLLHLPYKPISRPVFDFDAMARKDLSFGGESLTFKPHMVSGGQNLFREIDPSMEIKAVVTQTEWDREKERRALHIRTLRGASPLETRLRALGLSALNSFRQVKRLLWGNPVAALATSAVLCLIGVSLFVSQYRTYWVSQDNSLPAMRATHPINFYDIGSGTFFTVSSDTLPPIAAPSQAQSNNLAPLGVRYYKFACQGCESGSETFVGLLETMSDAARSGWKRRMEVTGVPEITPLLEPGPSNTQGRFVSGVKTIRWVDANTPEGRKLISAALSTPCPDGKAAQWCRE